MTRLELPDDVEALKAIVEERDARIAQQDERIRQLELENKILRCQEFGPNGQRRPLTEMDPGYLQAFLLFPELIEAAEREADRSGQRGRIAIESTGSTAKKKAPARRKKFPEHFPRYRSEYELPEDQRICVCGGRLHEIGEEVTRELERLEVTVVHEIARRKYACRQCEEVVKTAPGPARVIDKGLLGVGYLAHLITERFLFHQPYNRLERKYASEGLDLNRSVLCTSVQRCAELLEPIYEELKRRVIAGDVIRTDDTSVIVQRSSKGGSRKARLWAYLGLDGEHVYDYTEERSRDGPTRFLGEFRGYVQADAINTYDAFFGPGKATEVACWAHTKRKYDAAEETDPELAREAIERIRELYDVERVAKQRGLDATARRQLRQEESVPRLAALGDWLVTNRPKVLDKSPMGQAMDYTLRQWQALKTYCEDGRLEIDNNDTERALRQVAVGRKNWIFLGNEHGGRTAAVMYSLVMTAHALGLDPRTYLRDVLLRIAHESDVTKLTPQGWLGHFADEVQQHRLSILERLVAAQAQAAAS